MKKKVFKPIRRIKKTGKLAVASYMQWVTYRNHLDDFVINQEYKDFFSNEKVHNHKGELLYFYDYNPEHIPVILFEEKKDVDPIKLTGAIERFYNNTPARGIDFGNGVHYSALGLDCNGTPTLSHNTKQEKYTIPLTVGLTIKWFDWFIQSIDYNKRLTTPLTQLEKL